MTRDQAFIAIKKAQAQGLKIRRITLARKDSIKSFVETIWLPQDYARIKERPAIVLEGVEVQWTGLRRKHGCILEIDLPLQDRGVQLAVAEVNTAIVKDAIAACMTAGLKPLRIVLARRQPIWPDVIRAKHHIIDGVPLVHLRTKIKHSTLEIDIDDIIT